MKTIYNDLVKVRNPETGAFESLPGIGSDSVELTQAEYDALPDTKLADNVTYYITDGEDVSSFVLGGAS